MIWLGVLSNSPNSSSKTLLGFKKFFNGPVKVHPSHSAIEETYVDASLQRVGEIYSNKVYTCPIPLLIQNLCFIVHFQAIRLGHLGDPGVRPSPGSGLWVVGY